jgi:O-antigen/teichoic acid export membrane protein
MACGLVLQTLSTTAGDVLQAFQRLPAVAGVGMIAGVTMTAGSVLAAWFGAGPVGVAVSYLLAPLISATLLFRIIWVQHFPVRVRWDRHRFKRLLWDARFIATQQLMASGSSNAEALIIPRLLGTTAFGYFSAGALLSNRLTAVPDGLCSAAYPAIVDAHRRGPREALRMIGQFLGLVMLVCLPPALLISLLAEPISLLLFPKRAVLCEQVMRITIWLLPAMGIQYIVGTALSAMHKDSQQAKVSLWAAGGSVLLAVTLISQFGLIGACWSLVLRYVLHLAILSPLAARTYSDLRAEVKALGTAAIPLRPPPAATSATPTNA